MADFLVSKATRDKLQEELKTLKTVRRPQVAKALEEARAHGDLKENAEYDAAKQEQALLEARIREVEDKLSRARLLEDENITGEHVSIGCVVTLKDLKVPGHEKYTLVGEEETGDVVEGRGIVLEPACHQGRALLDDHEAGRRVATRNLRLDQGQVQG